MAANCAWVRVFAPIAPLSLASLTTMHMTPFPSCTTSESYVCYVQIPESFVRRSRIDASASNKSHWRNNNTAPHESRTRCPPPTSAARGSRAPVPRWRSSAVFGARLPVSYNARQSGQSSSSPRLGRFCLFSSPLTLFFWPDKTIKLQHPGWRIPRVEDTKTAEQADAYLLPPGLH